MGAKKHVAIMTVDRSIHLLTADAAWECLPRLPSASSSSSASVEGQQRGGDGGDGGDTPGPVVIDGAIGGDGSLWVTDNVGDVHTYVLQTYTHTYMQTYTQAYTQTRFQTRTTHISNSFRIARQMYIFLDAEMIIHGLKPSCVFPNVREHRI